MSKIEELLAKYNGNLFDAIQFDEWYKAKISRNEIITERSANDRRHKRKRDTTVGES